ncbi:alpha/beta fold hydrolase [Paucidesulfovibrio longus]|uniref:alpha/beta fold hydrolase n=1 Tax=Paucidesulfovibrio longus TaxID=889 RepID=UPI0003B3E6CE|nr:alpha/beta hydrolase [Paucidesulfovibrio longus]
MKRICAALLVLLGVAGCAAGGHRWAARMDADPAWARIGVAAPLPVAGWLRGSARQLHVYIEGDGAAYATSSSPSLDPTPGVPAALLLALADPAPAVAYLGRPCQYVCAGECEPGWWTVRRFAPQAIQAQDALLTLAMETSGAERAVLFGYSGGGAVAALLSAERSDVAGLVTVAGNLDHALWTRLHGVTALSGSLNALDAAPRLGNVPQRHFVGERDAVVPEAVARSFCRALPQGTDVRIVVVPGLDHDGSAWAVRWPELLRELALPKSGR